MKNDALFTERMTIAVIVQIGGIVLKYLWKRGQDCKGYVVQSWRSFVAGMN